MDEFNLNVLNDDAVGNYVSYEDIDAIATAIQKKLGSIDKEKIKVSNEAPTTGTEAKYPLWVKRPGEGETKFKLYAANSSGSGYTEIEIGGSGGRDFNGFRIENRYEEEEYKKYLQLGTWETPEGPDYGSFTPLYPFVEVALPEGGGGGGSVISVTEETESPIDMIYGLDKYIEFYWASTKQGIPTGKAKFEWYVDNVLTVTEAQVVQKPESGGVKYQFNLNGNIKPGTGRQVRLVITDAYNTSISLYWTVNCATYSISIDNLASITYCGNGMVEPTKFKTFSITTSTSGTLGKNVTVYLDDVVAVQYVPTQAQRDVTIEAPVDPTKVHGVHTVKAKLDILSGETVIHTIWTDEYKLVWIDGSTGELPIIAVENDTFSIKQYTHADIQFMVITPTTGGQIAETTEITKTWTHYGETTVTGSQTQTVGTGITQWQYLGNDTTTTPDRLTIEASNTTTTVTVPIDVTVTESGIVLNILRNHLLMDVDPTAGTVGQKDLTFGYKEYSPPEYTSYTMRAFTYSPNFDWINGGFQLDDDGNKTFVIKRGSYVKFYRGLFKAEDRTDNYGKAIQMIFKIKNMETYNSQVAYCGGTGCPVFEVTGHEATFNPNGGLSKIIAHYTENEVNEVGIQFSKLSKANGQTQNIARFWDSGIPANTMLLNNDVFAQDSGDFTIGSNTCDIVLYRFKMYTINQTDRNMLDSYIADAPNFSDKAERYFSNNFLDSNDNIDKALLMKNCPNLHIITIEASEFPPDKGGTGKKDCVITHQVNRGTRDAVSYPANEQWLTEKKYDEKKGKWVQAKYTLQGTSSLDYVDSAPNIDLDMKSCYMKRISDGVELPNGYAFVDDTQHIPVKYFNLKANVASSECANNRCLVYRSNDYDECTTYAKTQDSRVRNTLYGEPCAVFIKNTSDTDVLYLTNKTPVEGSFARVLQPKEEIFYFAGDMINSKKNTDVVGEKYWTGLDGDNAGCDFVKGKDKDVMPNVQVCVEFNENNNYRCLFRDTVQSFDNESFEIDENDAKDKWLDTVNSIGQKASKEGVEGRSWETITWTGKKPYSEREKQFCFRYPEDQMAYGYITYNGTFGTGTSEAKEANKKALYSAILDPDVSDDDKKSMKELLMSWNAYEKVYNSFREFYSFVASCAPFPYDPNPKIGEASNPDYCPVGYTLNPLAETMTYPYTENFSLATAGDIELSKFPVVPTGSTSDIIKVYEQNSSSATPKELAYNHIAGERTITITEALTPDPATGKSVVYVQYYAGYDRDTKEYRLAKFSAGIGDYVHMDNARFHYLYTEFFLLIDNRAKNTFWTFEPALEGETIRWKWNVSKNYDNDTCLGTTNKGDLELRYGLEDLPVSNPTQLDELTYTPQGQELVELTTTKQIVKIKEIYSMNGTTKTVYPSVYYDYFKTKLTILKPLSESQLNLYVSYEYQSQAEAGTPQSSSNFNASSSCFWCNIRDTQSSSFKSLYKVLEDGGCFNKSNIVKQFNDYQKIRPEALMMKDAQAKYISPLTIRGAGESTYLAGMEFGSKKNQRSQFITDQVVYMASKYGSSTAKNNRINLNPHPVPDGSGLVYSSKIKVVPFSDMYGSVGIDNNSISTPVRISAGEEAYIQFVDTSGNPFVCRQEVAAEIYSGVNYTKIADLSHMFTKKFQPAASSKLQVLGLGSENSDYYNPNIDEGFFSPASFPLLTDLDVRGCIKLGSTGLDFKQNTILTNLNTLNTATTSVDFAKSSPLTSARLNGEVQKIYATELDQVTEFYMRNHDNLNYLFIEGCDGNWVKELFVMANKSLRFIRLTNVDWSFPDASLFVKAIYPEDFPESERWVGINGSRVTGGKAVITGKLRIDTMHVSEYNKLHEYFPGLDITYVEAPSKTIMKVTYTEYDGTTQRGAQYILKGSVIGTDPVTAGLFTSPTRPEGPSSEDPRYYYTNIYGAWRKTGASVNWNFSSDTVNTDIALIPQFTENEYNFLFMFLDSVCPKEEVFEHELFTTTVIPWHKNAWFDLQYVVETLGKDVPKKDGYVCIGFVPWAKRDTYSASDINVVFTSKKNPDTDDPMYVNPNKPYSTTLVPVFEKIEIPSTRQSLNNLSWAQIKAIADAGRPYQSSETGDYIYWATGTEEEPTIWFKLTTRMEMDEEGFEIEKAAKQITCYNFADTGSTAGYQYWLQPYGYQTERFKEDETLWANYKRIPITFGTIDLCESKMTFKKDSSLSYPWEESDIRKFLNGGVGNYTPIRLHNASNETNWTGSGYVYKLPIDLYSVITEQVHNQSIISSAIARPDPAHETVDKLFVPMAAHLSDADAYVYDTGTSYPEKNRQLQNDTYYIFKSYSANRVKLDSLGVASAYWTSYSSQGGNAANITSGGIATGSYQSVTVYQRQPMFSSLGFPFTLAIGEPRTVTP